MVLPDASSLIRGGAWASEDVEEPPYWQQIWPASVAAARVIPRILRPRALRVLDLGCGLGLPGIAAAAFGGCVTFADLHSDALEFVRWNLGSMDLGGASLVRIDWSREVVAGLFDVVILSDVSYRPVHHLALWRHLDACLAADGRVIHTEPFRREANHFVTRLAERFSVEQSEMRVSLGSRETRVRVCCAAR